MTDTAPTPDLRRFCATEPDPRKYLHEPWRDDRWVYATNGHLVVRVPYTDQAVPERTSKHPNVADMFKRVIDDRACEFMVMPPIPEPDKCKHCDGVGFVWSAKCPDCVDGEFVHRGWTYDCKNCQGSDAGPGRVDVREGDHNAERTPCAHCDFNGYELNRNGGTQIGEAHYATVYLWFLAQLPQCRVRPGEPAHNYFHEDGKRKPEVPAAFIFGGGQALLMPRRP
jgi:hypothetical protein